MQLLKPLLQKNCNKTLPDLFQAQIPVPTESLCCYIQAFYRKFWYFLHGSQKQVFLLYGLGEDAYNWLADRFAKNWSERSACTALGCWHKRRWPLI